MEDSVGQVQQTLRQDGGGRDRQRLDDRQDDDGSVNQVETVGVGTCQRRRRPPVSTTPVTVGDVHQYATCLLSSYQHNSYSSVAESSPSQNGRTFSSVLFNCNSKTAARQTPTFLKHKVTVLHTQAASSWA